MLTMQIDLTKEEADLIIDMVNYAEDPCMDSFWDMMYDDLSNDIEDENEVNEKFEKLTALRDVCLKKLRKIK